MPKCTSLNKSPAPALAGFAPFTFPLVSPVTQVSSEKAEKTVDPGFASLLPLVYRHNCNAGRDSQRLLAAAEGYAEWVYSAGSASPPREYLPCAVAEDMVKRAGSGAGANTCDTLLPITFP